MAIVVNERTLPTFSGVVLFVYMLLFSCLQDAKKKNSMV
jgi:hypothetical protein